MTWDDIEIKNTPSPSSDMWADLAINPEPLPAAPSVKEFERDQNPFSANEFSRGVARGGTRMVGSAVDFARVFYDSPKLKSIADEMADIAENIPTKAQSVQDVLKDPTLAPAYVSRVIGELAPQAVAAYLSGGGSVALAKGAGLTGNALRLAAGAGAAATSIPQEVGGIARETEERTGRIAGEEALVYGIPSGLLDAVSAERIIGKVFRAGSEEAKKRAWRGIVRDTLREVPKAAGVESITETAQEGLHLLADKSADETFELLTKENGARLLESAVAGAIGGGFLGGGMEVASLPLRKAQRNEIATQIRDVRKIRDEFNSKWSDIEVEQPAVTDITENPVVNPPAPAAPLPTSPTLPTPPQPRPSNLPEVPPYPTPLEGQPYELDQAVPVQPTPAPRVPRPLPEVPGVPTPLEGQPYDLTKQGSVGSKISLSLDGETETRKDFNIYYDGKQVGKMHIVRNDPAGGIWQSSIGLFSNRGEGIGRLAIQAAADLTGLRIHQSFRQAQSEAAQKMWDSIGQGTTTKDSGYGPEPLRYVDPSRQPEPAPRVRQPVPLPEVPAYPTPLEGQPYDNSPQAPRPAPDKSTTIKLQEPVEQAPLTAEQSRKNAAELTPEALQARLAEAQAKLAAWPPFTGTPQERMAQLTAKTKLANEAGFLVEAIKIQSAANPPPNEAPRIPKSAPSEVAPKAQAKSVPVNVEEVRDAEEPASESGSGLAAADLSVVGADDSLKTPIDLLFDPGAQSGKTEPEKRQGYIAINPKGKNSGRLLIQIRQGGKTRTIWNGSLAELEQSGAVKRTSDEEFSVDLEKLFSSNLLTKDPDKSFAAYKFPTDKAQRSGPLETTDVLIELHKLDEKVARMLQPLIADGFATPDVLKALATSHSGGKIYARNDPAQLAKQIVTGIRRFLEQEARLTAESKPADSQRLLAILEWLNNKELNSDAAGEAAAHSLTQTDSAQRLGQNRGMERTNADLGGETEDGVPEATEREGVWDEARIDGMLGLIEDKHPKLYASFEASATDDKAWAKIEQAIAKDMGLSQPEAEILAESVREKRAGGWMAQLSEFPELEAEQRWQTGLSAKGKQGITDLLSNRMVPFDPEMRRIGLALINRIPEKYLADLTMSVAEDGSIAGEFIPWLKVARIAMNNTNVDVAAHEASHFLASFLPDSERAAITEARKKELEQARTDNPEFVAFIEEQGGSTSSAKYSELFGMGNNPLYRLINDDEYFAHYMSQAAAKAPEQIQGLIGKAKDIISRIISAIKAWAGNRDAYFDRLLSKFEKGEFDVNAQGGMLWERNNGNAPKALKPISSMTELNKYREVDQGIEEQRQVNTLTVEQNEPMVGGDVAQKYSTLPDSVKSEIPWIGGRIEANNAAKAAGVSDEQTPLKHFGLISNWLHLNQEAKGLSDSIQSDLDKLTKLHKDQPKVSEAEARARSLDETARGLIRDYKSYLLSEQKKNQNAGIAAGLAEAIKNTDKLQQSSSTLERVVQHMAESFSLQELNDPNLTTQQLVELFKLRVAEESGTADWQNASIKGGDGKPGVSNEILRIAIRLMQQRQGLVQDVLTYKELSDPETMKAITENENVFDNEIATLNRGQLQSFLKSYYSVRNAKDKARQVYLKHRKRASDLVERINSKVSAQDWLNVNVLKSPRLQQALAESSQHGFMSADLVEDGQGGSALKRTYYNPLNREQTITIVDGTTRKDYQENEDKFEQVQKWYEDAIASGQLDPLDEQLITQEHQRIETEELNEAYNPEYGKRAPGAFNVPNMIANLRGNTLQFAMEKIGGRAAVKVILNSQIMSEGKRRIANARHQGQYKMQQYALEASKDHGIGNQRWMDEVVDPVLATYNSLGAKQLKVGDTTRYGHRVTQKDMKAIREMKTFIEAIADGVTGITTHTARAHPVLTKEIIAGRPIYREKQGHSDLIVPRRVKPEFKSLLKQWQSVKGSSTLKDATPALASFISEGEAFRDLVLAHIYSTQRYPDYVGKSRFGKAYREIYRNITNGSPPANLASVVDTVFESQTGDDPASQITKEQVAAEIVAEVDGISRRLADQEKTRSSETTSASVSVDSGDNFLTKPRGEMVAPDSAYQYGVLGNSDVRWLISSGMDVLTQRTRNALEKVEVELREWLAEFDNRARHPEPQKESRARQIAGDDWLNYREAKQMQNQVRRLLDTLKGDGIKLFTDEQISGIGNKFYSTLIQNLLQSMPVMARNLLGYNLRRTQFENELAGDKTWHGIPRWLVNLPGETVKGRGLVYPLVNTAKAAKEALVYRKVKKELTEDVLKEMVKNPDLMATAGGSVKASQLRSAVNTQRYRNLGAGESYGFKDQVERYIKQFYYGGDVEVLDPNTNEKASGAIKSVLGLIEETGAGFMLPRFIAPRKLEMFINSDAMRVAQHLIEDLELNIREAISNRAEKGRLDAPITDAELLGVHDAKKGDAMYLRQLLTRAGLNLTHVSRRLASGGSKTLLNQGEFDSLVQEVAKETNMSSDDNRPRYKSGFGRMMGALTGYAFWYGERQAQAYAPSSRKKGVDPAAVYRAMMFTGLIVAAGLTGTPLIRFLKDLLWDEEDTTGHFSNENTPWRNAAVLWEQTGFYWPIIGSIMNQIYDARSGSKALNVVPIGMANTFLRTINEVAQTGNAFYPTVNLIKSLSPNTRIALNRLPETEGLVDLNNANRILRGTATGEIEVRKPTPGKVSYSPATTQIQLAVNELNKANPDWNLLDQYRKAGAAKFVRAGASQADALDRFDKSVMVRIPQNTVYGRPLTTEERDKQFGLMSAEQRSTVQRVEGAFTNYANRFGLREPDLVQRPRKPRSTGRLTRGRGLGRRRVTRIKNARGRGLLRRRNRRLTRSV